MQISEYVNIQMQFDLFICLAARMCMIRFIAAILVSISSFKKINYFIFSLSLF